MSKTGRPLAPGVKRLMDVAGAGGALLVFAPVMAAVAAVVCRTTGRPVIFTQMRPGEGGKPFRVYKFRTMSDARDGNGQLLSDGDRLMSTGEVLRRWSLDELPELWNVLRGDMSLVGPRPLLVEYLDRYTPEQARRHEMRPGLTGLAQVEGRNLTSWEERLALDVYYVDHWSIALDLRIIAKTLVQVITGAGVSAEGHATMPKFEGSPSA